MSSIGNFKFTLWIKMEDTDDICNKAYLAAIDKIKEILENRRKKVEKNE